MAYQSSGSPKWRLNGGRKTPVTGRWITCIWTNNLAKLSSDGWLLVQIVDYRRRYECCIRNLAQGHNKGSVVRRCWQCQRVGFSNASRPYRLNLGVDATPDDIATALESTIPGTAWHDDVHGRPDWRRYVTTLLAAEIVAELAGGPRA